MWARFPTIILTLLYIFYYFIDKFQSLRDQLNEFGGYIVGVSRHRREARGQSYRNAFDIPRKNLLDQILRMRANFLNPSHTKLYHQGKEIK